MKTIYTFEELMKMKGWDRVIFADNYTNTLNNNSKPEQGGNKMYTEDGVNYHVDEEKIKFYDDINIMYGCSEDEKNKLREELEDELDGVVDDEELEEIIKKEISFIDCKDIKVKLLEDYVRWTSDSDFVAGATGVVHKWNYFRFGGRSWASVYVFVDILGEAFPVNIEKLEVLDTNFIKKEWEYFQQFKNKYNHDEDDSTLTLYKDNGDEIVIHCTALRERIVEYLECDNVEDLI